jgi:hypothetical protein
MSISVRISLMPRISPHFAGSLVTNSIAESIYSCSSRCEAQPW